MREANGQVLKCPVPLSNSFSENVSTSGGVMCVAAADKVLGFIKGYASTSRSQDLFARDAVYGFQPWDGRVA